MYEFISYEKKGHIAYLTIRRPEVMNALHPPAHRELAAAWDDFAADAECWVAVITGEGEKAFSAGNDLKYMAQHGDATVPPSGFGGITARYDLVKPTIAAVNGLALGGGFEIALACDLIVAADHARFGLPEPKVGLAALAGGMHRLPRQLPLKIAMGYMLTGQHMTAEEAARHGLVNEVVPASELRAAAERWARAICDCAPLSVQATKQAALDGLAMSVRDASEHKFPAVEKLLRSEDLQEGVKAFAEKRAPEWKAK